MTKQRRTSAERAAGVTPTDYAYPPGDAQRYGAVPNDSTERETLIAVIGYSLCAWVVLVVIAWSVWQMLDANKAQCQEISQHSKETTQ